MAQPQQHNNQQASQPQQLRDTAAAMANDANALDAAFPTRRAERRQAPRLKYQVVATLANGSSRMVETVGQCANLTNASLVRGKLRQLSGPPAFT